MEFGAELADIYSDLYEYELKKPTKNGVELNSVAAKCTQNGNVFTSIVYKKHDDEDKYEYI